MLCPCQSKDLYRDCCQVFHLAHAKPVTAEQLMRSRYSAFVLHHIDYIIQTTLPLQQPLLDKNALMEWAKNTDWRGLEIVQHQPNVGKRHALVEFKAFFQAQQQQHIHHECSAFVYIQDTWFFLDPTVPIHRTMKQPCICGSTDKFKQCCASFLR